LTIKFPYEKDPILKLADFYLFQSYYAIDHFKNLEHKYYLSDYLNKDFLKIETDLSNKEDIVAFNPKKDFLLPKNHFLSKRYKICTPNQHEQRRGYQNSTKSQSIYRFW
jgi:hypothetical protein